MTRVIGKPVTVNPLIQAMYRPRLEIYNRKNSEFNRLTSNNIDFASYESFIDQKNQYANQKYANQQYSNQRYSNQQYTNQQYTATTQRPYNQRIDVSNDFTSTSNTAVDQTESRIRVKKRPCVPIWYNPHNGRDSNPGSGRTLWDLNFYFLGYTPNSYYDSTYGSTGSNSQYEYDTYGGYQCKPNPYYKPSLIHNLLNFGLGQWNKSIIFDLIRNDYTKIFRNYFKSSFLYQVEVEVEVAAVAAVSAVAVMVMYRVMIIISQVEDR